jgi:hypothetical protein
MVADGEERGCGEDDEEVDTVELVEDASGVQDACSLV